MANAKPAGKSLLEMGLRANAGAMDADPRITGICVDSRKTNAGDLFVAMSGVNGHGGEFIQYALRMDAAAVLTDAAGLEIAKRNVAKLDVPFIISDDPRLDLARAAARFYAKQPATMTAVTGTNGKTSVANFTRQIWENLGKQATNFGTAGVEGAYTAPLSHTTPEPVTLHKLLAELSDAGITHASMEASSHGLDQRRLDGVYLTAAGFTNFTQDHLDYHETFEAYFDAKAGLFTRVLPPEGSAVINMDDPRGADIKKLADARGQDVITIGSNDCDITILNSRFDATGQDVRFSWRGDVRTVRLSLIGGFQVQNVMMAAGLVIASGEQAKDVFDTLVEMRTVSGRMELAATRQNGAPVFVDYAHTPDAVETALRAMRPHIMGRLIVVLGAGGDRDTSKRKLMGAAAAANADVVFVTDDNPRSEDPASIREMVMQGCPDANNVGDRAQAILRGVDALQPGDALLIAGKGHETGQTIGNDVLPFNDVEQASVAVAALDGMGA
ncbi:UDP-N-acetylmuramoyl-L-alanyl-D-glutamate--2,6-diaminopimelate ligase [Amylibacter ulvae]|uniref:UDP-N-acetylmuramoyl-L-alanyl-D-glutamate--2,6-diaminopimelate ligase n=1 Tax=Paramylibacter ulvae TaxID=1651968 RepID=A0ABQ3D1Z5_9RHOB|nr:UDP-N-acetylmuramoyl-L-alanyl-D-glutamate--2,6-diaminopimelate ligase [Amylibacter ulvae]